MKERSATVWQNKAARNIARVFALLDSTDDVQNFMRDVMTDKEILEISARLEAASMLADGKKYTEIIEKTKLSSRTVARISDWMQNGAGGYGKAIELLDATHHTHLSPARAE